MFYVIAVDSRMFYLSLKTNKCTVNLSITKSEKVRWDSQMIVVFCGNLKTTGLVYSCLSDNRQVSIYQLYIVNCCDFDDHAEPNTIHNSDKLERNCCKSAHVSCSCYIYGNNLACHYVQCIDNKLPLLI